MNTQELLEKWNDRMVLGNRLSKEIEDFDGILYEIEQDNSKICISSGSVIKHLDVVLDGEALIAMKTAVANTLQTNRQSKIDELRRILGDSAENTVIEEEKEVVANEPTPETGQNEIQNVNNAFNHQAMTVESVKEYYHDQDMTLDEVALKFGVSRATLHKFITNNNLRKPSKRDRELYRDSEVQHAKKSSR